MRFRIIVLAAVSLIARAASAQLVAAKDANPIGTWRGTSQCVAASGCTDDIVVFRITQKATSDSLTIDTRRVVDGREEDMGQLACDLNAPRAFVTCTMGDRRWRFTVRHDSLVGQLGLRNGPRLREVHAVRSPEAKR